MAFIVITCDIPSDSIAKLNEMVKSGKPHEGVTEIRNLMDALLAGAKDGSVSVDVRASDPTVVSSGGGVSATYDLK